MAGGSAEYCAVGKPSSGPTCFTYESLVKIAVAYNNAHPEEEPISLHGTRAILHRRIERRLKHLCEKEYCWTELPFIKALGDEEISTETFRPIAPHDSDSELTTAKIFKALEQYEKKFPTVFSFGAPPSNYRDFPTRYPNPRLKTLLKKGYTTAIGVFNTEPIPKDGKHWVGIAITLKRTANRSPGISYFDSTGNYPTPELKDVLIAFQEQQEEIGIRLPIRINTFKHQKRDGECGTYALWFCIQTAIYDVPFKTIVSRIIDDDTMNSKRKHFFRPAEDIKPATTSISSMFKHG